MYRSPQPYPTVANGVVYIGSYNTTSFHGPIYALKRQQRGRALGVRHRE
jgi:hypothetical protein